MALIECPECKKQVSSEAHVCINCGYLNARNLPLLDRLQKLSAIVVAATVPIVGGIYGYFQQAEARLMAKQAMEEEHDRQDQARRDEKYREAQALSRTRADRAMEVLERLGNKDERTAAAMMALYFASVGELHPGIVTVLARTAEDENDLKEVLQSYLGELEVKVKGKMAGLETEMAKLDAEMDELETGREAGIDEAKKEHIKSKLNEMKALSVEIAAAFKSFKPTQENLFSDATKGSVEEAKVADDVINRAVHSEGDFVGPLVAEMFTRGKENEDPEIDDKAIEAVIAGVRVADREAREAKSLVDSEKDETKKSELQEKASKAIEKVRGLVEATKSGSKNARADVIRQLMEEETELDGEQRGAVLEKIVRVATVEPKSLDDEELAELLVKVTEASKKLADTQQLRAILAAVTEASNSLEGELMAEVLGSVSEASKKLGDKEGAAVLAVVTQVSESLEGEQLAGVLGGVTDASESMKGEQLAGVLADVTEVSENLDDRERVAVLGGVTKASRKMDDKEQQGAVLGKVAKSSESMGGEQLAGVLADVTEASEKLDDKERAAVLGGVTEASKKLDDKEQKGALLGKVAKSSESMGGERLAGVLADVTEASEELDDKERAAVLGGVTEASKKLDDKEQQGAVLGKVAKSSESMVGGEQMAEVLDGVTKASEKLGDMERAAVLGDVTEASKKLDDKEQQGAVLGKVAKSSESMKGEQMAEVLADVTKASEKLGGDQREAVLGKVVEASREKLNAEERGDVFQNSATNRIVIAINHEDQRKLGEQILKIITEQKVAPKSIGVIENVIENEKNPEIPASTVIRYQRSRRSAATDGEKVDKNQSLAKKLKEIVDAQFKGTETKTEGLSDKLVGDGEFEIWFGASHGQEKLP